MYINTDKTYYNLLLKNYPQYESLRRELMKLIFRKAINKGERVDCYVNLNSYIRSIYSRVDYKYDEKLSITASIINFAAHLKEFFASRFSIYARVFLVYGNQRSQNAVKFVSEYDAHRELERKKDPLIEQIVVDDLSKCKEIVKYIPDVFMISNQDAEPGVIIREIIKSESSMGNKFPRLIFSKDLYDYQLVSSCPNTHLIRVKKTFNGDMTFTVSYFDFYKKLSSVLKLKYGIGEKVSPELYSIYMTLSGCRDRNIRGFINYPRADKLIHGLLAKGLLFNGYNPSFGVNPESFYMFFDTVDEKTGDHILLYNRYCALDIITQCQLFEMNSPSYHTLRKNIVNLYDPEGIKALNSKYFKKYPLDLNVF